MDDYPERNRRGSRHRFSRRVEAEERRKLRARRRRERRIWFGLGMFGIVGWAFGSIPAGRGATRGRSCCSSAASFWAA
mgnify:CR=1 FL=1